MKSIPRNLVIISVLIILRTGSVCSQVLPVDFTNSFYPGKEKAETGNSTLPIGIRVASFFYLLNPIVLFQNDRIGGGLTKEISLGFGYFG